MRLIFKILAIPIISIVYILTCMLYYLVIIVAFFVENKLYTIKLYDDLEEFKKPFTTSSPIIKEIRNGIL